MAPRYARPRACKTSVTGLLVLAGLLAAGGVQAQTATWMDMATVSGTLVPGRVCAVDANGKDIVCDSSMPSTAGLGVTDRIVSDTQKVVVNQGTGVVDLMTGNTAWGYLNPNGFSYLPYLNSAGVSSTGTVSGTTGYFMNRIAVNTLPSNFQVDVLGGIASRGASGGLYLLDRSNAVSATVLYRENNKTRFYDGTNGDQVVLDNATGNVGIGTAAPGATLHVSGNALISSTSPSNNSLFVGGITNVGNEGIRLHSPHDGNTYLDSRVSSAGGLQIRVDSALGGTPRMFIAAAGNVGIGTTNPQTALQVVKNSLGVSPVDAVLTVEQQTNSGVNTDSNALIRFYHQNGANNRLWYMGTGSNSKLGHPDNFGFIDSYTGRTPLVMTAFGLVGISTTAPSTSLHVNGTLRIANGGEACDANRLGGIRYNSGSSQFEVCRTAGAWETMVAGASGTAQTDRITSGTTSVIANQDASVAVSTNGVQRMVVGTNGNVGIGTGPINGYNLYVSGTSSGLIGLTGGAATGYVGTTGYGMNFGAITAHPVVVFTSSTERLRVTENGNVGIGTATPDSLLHLLGNNPVFNLQNNNGAGGSGGVLRFGHTQGSGDVPIGEIRGVLVNGAIPTRAGSLGFFTSMAGALNERMRITDSGNVGIGTTAPSATLHLYNPGTARMRVDGGNLAVGLFRTEASAVDERNWQFYANSANNTIRLTALNDAQNAEVPAMVVQRGTGTSISSVYFPNGNVGIGTAAPGGLLHVNSAQDGTGLIVGATSNTMPRINLINSYKFWSISNYGVNQTGRSGGFAIADETSGTVRIFVSSLGRVGIGNVDPQAALDVSGTLRVKNGGEACDANRLGGMRFNAGTSQFEICRNGSAWETMVAGTGGSVQTDRITSGTTSVIANQDSSVTVSTNGVQRMVVGTNGNVGIGVANPNYQLDVNGSIRATGSGNLLLSSNVNFSPYILISGTTAASGLAQTGSGLIFKSGTDVNTISQRMIIDNTGNVGIGTTAPSGTLHVFNASNPTNVYVGGGGVNVAAAQVILQSLNGNNFRGMGTQMYDAGGNTSWFAGRPYNGNDNFIIARQTAPDVGTGSVAQMSNALMTVTNVGNVGIGTTAPSGTLHVFSNSGNGLFQSSANTRQILISPGGASINFSTTEGTGIPLHINRNSANALLLNSGGGRVGVGLAELSAPKATLDVSGTAMVAKVAAASQCSVAADVGKMYRNANGRFAMCDLR